ncbi:MAG: Bug family tripartite tricarboxylate transporter substrate binding protein [Burkholderiales bacterium]
MKRPAFLAAAMLAAAVPAPAQTYPAKGIRMITPSTPGGGTDLVARIISQKLSESLGRSVVVENRPGVDGIAGTDVLAKAMPDGYTIGMAQPGPMTIARSLYPTLPYDPTRDFEPIVLANESVSVLVVHPSLPARSVAEFVALAKTRTINSAYPNVGTVQHLLTELFHQAARIRVNPIPYKGGAPALTDTIGGHVDALWSVLPVALPFIQNGKLRPLAVANDRRSVFLPNVPTFAETGWPKVVGTAWNGVIAPAGTPREIILRLNTEIRTALSTPEIRERYSALGMELFKETTPAEFGAYMQNESTKWRGVITTANIKLDQ